METGVGSRRLRRHACGAAGLVLVVTALLTMGGTGLAAQTPSRPNIVLIMTDDQGYGDLSCHGNPVLRTPHLDALAAQSVRFTDFHVSPTCAPTRSALMTGRHEFKNGVTHTIFERERLSPSAITLPQVLREAGYQTGIFGKWHLGDEDAYQPGQRGFDEVFIHGAGGIGQTYAGSCGDAPGNSYFDPVIRHNGQFVKTKGYCTDVFFDQAAKWVTDRPDDRPFFCYITPNAPHSPLDCPPEYVQRYAGQVPDDVARFYGMIANIDDNVGRLLALLQERKLDEQTVVIFMTDNGSATGAKFYNAGMHGNKGTPYNGGTRVPAFWRWTGHWQPATCDAFACHWDILPTLLEIAGIAPSDQLSAQIEGSSLVPLLTDPRSTPAERFFFTHLGRWDPRLDPRQSPDTAKYAHCSVRWKQWTLVSNVKAGPVRWELYDLQADPGEKHDVSADHADVVATMSAAYDEWWTSILPNLENEQVTGPDVNPFKAAYWAQFQGPGPNGVAPPK